MLERIEYHLNSKEVTSNCGCVQYRATATPETPKCEIPFEIKTLTLLNVKLKLLRTYVYPKSIHNFVHIKTTEN